MEGESPQQQPQNYFRHSPKETLKREKARGTERARVTGKGNVSGLSVSELLWLAQGYNGPVTRGWSHGLFRYCQRHQRGRQPVAREAGLASPIP